MEQQLLEKYCKQLEEATQNAIQWVGDNYDLVKNDSENLQKDLRRAGRTYRKCYTSLRRKMCAGVFGPSQAGKSYLLSALARDSNNQLFADFDDKQLDFITEINPEGGKESTGLVTRFTMTPLPQHPAGYSVGLRLLSETDLVKIIANTYYADCEHKEVPDDLAIQNTLQRLESRAGSPCAHLTLDHMEDLREYVTQEFGARPRVQTLEKVFWNQAQELAPKLNTDDRVALYSLIWNEIPQFTDLLYRLVKALEQLRYPNEAFCSLDALTPRDTSIIDVAMLQGLEGQSTGDLTVATADGLTTTLPRALVTALTAELTIVMKAKPADFFEHTDLLDFPGYRSRYKITDIAHELANKEGMTTQMFLRGKVAYLFQRYCAERELTSMLLCIGPSNQEVQDLPAVINDWIASTHGNTEEERAEISADSLFFILTKFDIEFEQKKGATDTKSRWDNRLHASLLDFFGKQHDWPTRWKNNQAFNNIFLLRNPNFRFDAIMDIDDNGVEKGIRQEKLSYVDDLKQSFLGSELVSRHFAQPREAWEEAMKLNDGGISYIRTKLSPLCNPDLKREQLEKTIFETRNTLLGRLKKYHFSDDKEEERRKKNEFIRRFFYIFKNREILQQRFGEMLNTFTLNIEEVYALHPEAERRYNQYVHSEEEKAHQEDSDAMDNIDLNMDLSLDDLLSDDFGSGPSTASEEQTAAPNRKDEHSFYAMQIMSTWVAHMHSIAQSSVLQRYYGLPAAEFTTMVNEIDTGAQRLRLPDQLEDAFRTIAQPADVSKDSKVRKQASLAVATINEFIAWLGKSPAHCVADKRFVSIEGKSMPVFADKPEVGEEPVLEETFRPYTGAWYRDWLRVFTDLLMHNVDFDGETTLNREQNALLGNILSRMENA